MSEIQGKHGTLFLVHGKITSGMEGLEILKSMMRFDLNFLQQPAYKMLVLIAYAGSEGSGEPAQTRSLARAFTARTNDTGT